MTTSALSTETSSVASVFTSKAEALAHTKALNDSLDATLDLIFTAWQRKIWAVLDDVDDWPSYVAKYAPRIQTLRLKKAARLQLVIEWSGAGMTQRDLAVGLNVSNGTAANDVAEVIPFDPEARVRSKDGSLRARRVLKPAPEPVKTCSFRDRLEAAVEAAGARGMTRKELCRKFKADGGAVSGALTPMHRSGRLIRTEDVRDDCYVYVTPPKVEAQP